MSRAQPRQTRGPSAPRGARDSHLAPAPPLPARAAAQGSASPLLGAGHGTRTAAAGRAQRQQPREATKNGQPPRLFERRVRRGGAAPRRQPRRRFVGRGRARCSHSWYTVRRPPQAPVLTEAASEALRGPSTPPLEVRGRSLSAYARSRNGWLRRQAEDWVVVCARYLRCGCAGGTARDIVVDSTPPHKGAYGNGILSVDRRMAPGCTWGGTANDNGVRLRLRLRSRFQSCASFSSSPHEVLHYA